LHLASFHAVRPHFCGFGVASTTNPPPRRAEYLETGRESGKIQAMILPILEYPDPRLRRVAAPVRQFGPDIAKLARDMAETMYAAPGIGLAATQVDVHKRVIVMDISDDRNELRVFINPELVVTAGEEECEEGCLSVPGYYDKVTRAATIKVRAQDEHGMPFEVEADGLLAVCIQHEMDHLLGKVFVDYLSPLKRARLNSRLKKKQKLAG
jgi:peptide deformylase